MDKENSANFTCQTISSPIASSTFNSNRAKPLYQNSTINIDSDIEDDDKYELTMLRKELADILKDRKKKLNSNFEERKSSLHILTDYEMKDDIGVIYEKNRFENCEHFKSSNGVLREGFKSNVASTERVDDKESSFRVTDDSFKISLAPDFDDENTSTFDFTQTLTNSQIKKKSAIIDNARNDQLRRFSIRSSIGEFFFNRTPNIEDLGLDEPKTESIINRKPISSVVNNANGELNSESVKKRNYQLLLQFNKKKIDLGVVPQFATKKECIVLKNFHSKSVKVELQINSKFDCFTFTPINFDDKRMAKRIYRSIEANSEISVIVQLLFDENVPNDSKSLDLCAKMVATCETDKDIFTSTELTAVVAFTKIDFKITEFPLNIPFGENTFLMFKNNGLLATEFDVLLSECSSCNGNIFSVHPKKINLVPEEVGTITISFNAAPNHCTERYVILRDSNGFTCSCSINGIVDNLDFRSLSLNERSDKLSIVSHDLIGISKNSSLLRVGSEYSCSERLPIETTKTCLTWECVKVNFTEIQNFTIRNKSDNKIKLRIFIKSPEFKFVRDGSSLPFSENQIVLKLNSRESHTIKVAFTPTSVRPYFAKIFFQSYFSNNHDKSIMMIGYGGHVSIGFQRVLKDGNERMWLDFGFLDNNRLHLTQTISIYNHGVLPLVVLMSLHKKSSLSTISFEMETSPSQYTISAESKMDFKVKIIFSRDSLKQLQKKIESVIELGIVTVQYAAECTLTRLKKLFCKYPNQLDLGLKQILDSFKKMSPVDSEENPSEPKEAVKYLQSFIKSKEVIVTIQKDERQDFDNETCVFYSLMGDVTTTSSN